MHSDFFYNLALNKALRTNFDFIDDGIDLPQYMVDFLNELAKRNSRSLNEMLDDLKDKQLEIRINQSEEDDLRYGNLNEYGEVMKPRHDLTQMPD